MSMLPASYRLKHRDAFKQLYQQGQRRTGSLCVITWLPIPEPTTQVAIVVSKKVSRRAVDRNRVRRQIRAALLQLWPSVKPGFWILINVRSQALGRTGAELAQELLRLLSKAKLLVS